MQHEKVWQSVERTDLHNAQQAVLQLQHAADMMQSVIEHTEFTNSYSNVWDSANRTQFELGQELRIAQHNLDCFMLAYDAKEEQVKLD